MKVYLSSLVTITPPEVSKFVKYQSKNKYASYLYTYANFIFVCWSDALLFLVTAQFGNK